MNHLTTHIEAYGYKRILNIPVDELLGRYIPLYELKLISLRDVAFGCKMTESKFLLEVLKHKLKIKSVKNK